MQGGQVWGARIPHALRPKNQNIKHKQYSNEFNKDFTKSSTSKNKKKSKKTQKTNKDEESESRSQ